MIVELAHARWRKRLLENRKLGAIYQMIGLTKDSVKDFTYMFKNGAWQFRVDYQTLVEFTDVNKATDFIISLGVEEYDKEFGL